MSGASVDRARMAGNESAEVAALRAVSRKLKGEAHAGSLRGTRLRTVRGFPVTCGSHPDLT
jgi:hypothetical protein